jgi:pyrimidine-specific ribonucleoside hydrolase
MTNIIIDTDPGHDDAIAISLILAHEQSFTVRGCISVAGNQTIDHVTDNLKRILSFYRREDIPVCRGSERPLSRPLETGAFAHGDSGMDGPTLPVSTMIEQTLPPSAFIRSILKDSQQNCTLLALGPLTNIARFIKEAPEMTSRIDQIVLMGGGINGGNMTSAAEFNFYVDPEAADIVFTSGIPIVMAGLDVTGKALIYDEEIDALRNQGAASLFTTELLDFYSRYGKQLGYTGSALHDPCAAAYLIQPELFSVEDLFIQIETRGEKTRGMSLADRRIGQSPAPNTKVLTGVDRTSLIKLLTDSLSAHDHRLAAATDC